MRTLKIFAPAKINLYLHVTGRRDDGYHKLDSLVAFADIGDQIIIREAEDFSFKITGPFGHSFNGKEKDHSPHSSNLAVRAAWLAARQAQKNPHVEITLNKNLPLAAGLGGGSSDAAAVLWGLMEWWNEEKKPEIANNLIRELGADLPVCFFCRPAQVTGIGEKIYPVNLPEIPIVLVNPGKVCTTRDAFLLFSGPFKDELSYDLNGQQALLDLLGMTDNVLYNPALQIVPDIQNVIHALKGQTGCDLARMTGSGASCFGLFESSENAQKACETIAHENPDWWVHAGTLNRPERY